MHDGNGIVYILELKKSKGYDRGETPIEQVEGYIEKYKDDEKYRILLKNYPMVENLNITEYKGVVIKGDKDTDKIFADLEKGYTIIKIPEKF